MGNLNDAMTNECENMKENILQQVKKKNKKTKGSTTVTMNTPTSSKHTTAENENIPRKTQRKITGYLERSSTSEKFHMNDELRPPQHNNTTQKEYISKFEYGTRAEAIVR